MQVAHIDGATRVIGKAQGYFGLPLRDEEINCPVNGPGTPRMLTAWTPNKNPTRDYLAAAQEAINAVAAIERARARQAVLL